MRDQRQRFTSAAWMIEDQFSGNPLAGSATSDSTHAYVYAFATASRSVPNDSSPYELHQSIDDDPVVLESST